MASSKKGKAAAVKTGPRARRKTRGAELAAREDVIVTAQQMSVRGLSPGRSGNVSMRFGAGMLITPSGVPYDTLQPADIVFVDGDGRVADGGLKPSSEWQFHLSALSARVDRHAVVHTHSRNALALACRHEAIPAFHYMVAAAGGIDIPCVPYALFGSTELADHVAAGLTKRDACLMANHGMIALGRDLGHALELAAEVEELAAQYVTVLQLGKPKLLTKAQMAEVLERFKTYGQNAQSAPADG